MNLSTIITGNPNMGIIIKDPYGRHKKQEIFFKNMGIKYRLVDPKDLPKDDPYWLVDEGCYYCGKRGNNCGCG